MSQFLYVIFVLFVFIWKSQALQSEKCQMTPKEKHCLIEYSVRDRWPHKVRYVYNWHQKNCYEIRWSDNCPAVPSPPVDNNFDSEKQCIEECGGWA